MSSVAILPRLPCLAAQRVSSTSTPSDRLSPISVGPKADDPSEAGDFTHSACSNMDLLCVTSYTPSAGDKGTLISVDVTCKAGLSDDVQINLIVGRHTVNTQVLRIHPQGYGPLQLKGSAPAFSSQQSSSAMVPLRIQVLDNANHVLQSVTFGVFMYLSAAMSVQLVSSKFTQGFVANDVHPRSTLRTVSEDPLGHSFKHHQRPYSRPSSRLSSHSDNESESSHDSLAGPSHRSTQATLSLPRATRHGSTAKDTNTRGVALDIITPLDTFSSGLTELERRAGRRLIRFHRIQDGHKLTVSAERISPSEYDPDDIVISCVYHDESASCYVTSVDIMHLIHRLVVTELQVEEKNRIRRNLECFRPTTVSKTKAGFEGLFKRIMDFPDPKPRKIEKDIKVFEWKVLTPALRKIISKYALCPAPSSTKDASRHRSIEDAFLPSFLDIDIPFPDVASPPSSSESLSSPDSLSTYEESETSSVSYDTFDFTSLPSQSHPQSQSPVPHLLPFPPHPNPAPSLVEGPSQQLYDGCYWDSEMMYGSGPGAFPPSALAAEDKTQTQTENTSVWELMDNPALLYGDLDQPRVPLTPLW